MPDEKNLHDIDLEKASGGTGGGGVQKKPRELDAKSTEDLGEPGEIDGQAMKRLSGGADARDLQKKSRVEIKRGDDADPILPDKKPDISDPLPPIS